MLGPSLLILLRICHGARRAITSLTWAGHAPPHHTTNDHGLGVASPLLDVYRHRIARRE